jgi:hypothetical protein
MDPGILMTLFGRSDVPPALRQGPAGARYERIRADRELVRTKQQQQEKADKARIAQKAAEQRSLCFSSCLINGGNDVRCQRRRTETSGAGANTMFYEVFYVDHNCARAVCDKVCR